MTNHTKGSRSKQEYPCCTVRELKQLLLDANLLVFYADRKMDLVRRLEQNDAWMKALKTYPSRSLLSQNLLDAVSQLVHEDVKRKVNPRRGKEMAKDTYGHHNKTAINKFILMGSALSVLRTTVSLILDGTGFHTSSALVAAGVLPSSILIPTRDYSRMARNVPDSLSDLRLFDCTMNALLQRIKTQHLFGFVFLDYMGTLEGRKTGPKAFRCEPKEDIKLLFENKLLAHGGRFVLTLCPRGNKLGRDGTRAYVEETARKNGYKLEIAFDVNHHRMWVFGWTVVQKPR